MGKAETKYANTARKMDEALLRLLAAREFEAITVTDVCDEARVHRSTFYAHYANTAELLEEVRRTAMEDFFESFSHLSGNSDFLSREYLLAYLRFLKDKSTVFKAIMKHADLFDPDAIFLDLREPFAQGVFGSDMHNVKYPEHKLRFISGGITCLVAAWLESECAETEERMADIIVACIDRDSW